MWHLLDPNIFHFILYVVLLVLIALLLVLVGLVFALTFDFVSVLNPLEADDLLPVPMQALALEYQSLFVYMRICFIDLLVIFDLFSLSFGLTIAILFLLLDYLQLDWVHLQSLHCHNWLVLLLLLLLGSI